MRRSSRSDIAENLLFVEEDGERVAVREIISDTDKGLRYRAEIGDSHAEKAVVDALTADELRGIIPVAVRGWIAARRLRIAR